MNCPDCHDALQRFLDGAPIAAETEAHLAGCSACRELFGSARCLQAGLSHLVQSKPPAGLAAAITRKVLRERSRRRAARWLTLSAAAAILMVFTIHGLTPRSTLPTRADRPEPERSTVAAAMPSLQGNVEQAGQALASLTRRTASETFESSLVLLPSVAFEAPADEGRSLTAIPEESQRAWDGVRDGVAQGIEPLTTSARRAFTLFRRDVPLLNSQPPRGL